MLKREGSNVSPPPPDTRDGYVFGPFNPSRARGLIRGINSLLEVAINTNEFQGRTLEKAMQTMEQLSEAFCSLSEDVESLNRRIHRLERHQIATHTHLAERIDNLEELANKAGPSRHLYTPMARHT